MPPEVPERGRPSAGGPYREAPSTETPADVEPWLERFVPTLVLTPWLVPLWQALHGREPFGWSATIGLVATLTLIASLGRAIAARVEGRLR